MPAKLRAFSDTSALFAGIWSASGGSRMILKLGEADAIQPVISRHVLEEIDNVVRSKAPDILGALALVLDRSHFEVSSVQGTLERVQAQLQYPGDVRILAAALETNVDYFVTLDRKHFLNDDALREAIPFPMGTPGDFLDWYRSTLQNISSNG